MKVQFIPDSLETSVFMPFVIILLYILGVIPFTAYISEELVKFIANQKKATRIVLINAIILTPILVASLMYYNEYKEKGLVEAMDYESDEFEGLMVMGLDIRTTQKEHADEIMEFLSRYNVKRCETVNGTLS
ncbi:hypothetical protein [Piscibacillus salipiscarius]|uniref:hypothetical protein n=1 Tax=Piscibacillus salipiscarius TaxID=299480 RepID=UPI0006D1C980|nr:hypothetical protein [Piscibacillus salipiscarius]